MIKVKGLNKFYNKNKSNEIHVINGVSLELPSQGLVSFLGASGSGKTTLLNVIGGLDKAQGAIEYDSYEMKKYDMAKIDKYRNENFGYVFQTYNLLLNETVYDNLKIALELIDIYDEKEVSSRIEYALKSVGMYKYRKKKASQLSGGQQQRVAIARALVKHCKVIIADEPTGNLDRANAVEVMNILKSISKRTLVLLVTHNEQLANFYSDFIYKIEDGKIIDEYKNLSESTLESVADNVIYLKDMKLTEGDIEGVSVKLYLESEGQLQLEIVERNNTFYIKSNKNIKLADGSNIKFVDEHYKPVERKTVDSYDYDDSFFNNSIKKRNVFQDFFTGLKRSFNSFIKPTKKVKIIYSSLRLIGILFAICAIAISNAITVNTSSFMVDENYHVLSSGDRYLVEDGEDLEKNLKNGNISSVQMVYERYFDVSYQLNYMEKIGYSTNCSQIYFNDKVNKILYGREPQGDEIAISLALADELLEVFSKCCNSYEELFDLTVYNRETKIVGIVKGDYKMLYLSESAYLNNVTSHIRVEDDGLRYYSVEKAYDTYEIVAGRDLTDADYDTGNMLISENYPNYEELLGSGGIVGVYHMKGVTPDVNEIILNIQYPNVIQGAYKYSYSVEDYVLVEGEHPKKDNECLVSIYSDLKIGEKFQGYKVVGRYNATTQLLRAQTLLSTSALSIDNYSVKIFIIENKSELLANYDTTNLQLKSMLENEYDMAKNVNSEKMAIFGILGAISLILAAVMVFFLMRSKMINDIYSIGVYRSLGSSKFKIYLKYFCDALVMVTFTALVTYFIVMVGYLTAIDSINEYWMMELFSKSLLVPFVGVGVLYLINIVFGLLPIFTLLRKTPSEILVKYDI